MRYQISSNVMRHKLITPAKQWQKQATFISNLKTQSKIIRYMNMRKRNLQQPDIS